MRTKKLLPVLLTGILLTSLTSYAQDAKNIIQFSSKQSGIELLILIILVPVCAAIVYLYFRFKQKLGKSKKSPMPESGLNAYTLTNALHADQIERLLKVRTHTCRCECKSGNGNCKKIKVLSILLPGVLASLLSFAQTPEAASQPLMKQPGIIITIFLILIPVLLGVVFALIKANQAIRQNMNKKKLKAAKDYAGLLEENDNPDFTSMLEKRNAALRYSLTNHELSGTSIPEDPKGIVHNVHAEHMVHFTAAKKKAVERPPLDRDITKLILWYIGCSVFWLIAGTSIGEYVGIKFVSPDADHISWLSFGRLRPVHTNMVFWGWASLGMIALGYYVVPTVSNTKIFSIKWGWIALILTNLMVIGGTACLMAGINNGGGEFREYIWPVMALFAVALILTLANFVMTVARRTTREIYISNWYIVSAIIFTIIVALTAYLPFWQNGIGETIIQGYFMHSGVGMWFTLYTLGLLYYFIPQQLNKPIYAYSLGILAFWTQILFYTIIGTHHFVFSAIPWWLQTVAIVGSAGMIIPVVAATINYTMTFRGQWKKVSNSYTLPFFLVAVIFYFIVSMQGTAEAFKFTNLLWHFTDFTVGHAHLGFYGIITFALWGGMYAIIPRLTGKEPPQHAVGAHFWLAFTGLLFYAIPLSIGGTLRGLMWMEQKPFIDSVVMMFDYWLWRAIGGSLMVISHFIFAYNFYKMVARKITEVDIHEEAIKVLEEKTLLNPVIN